MTMIVTSDHDTMSHSMSMAGLERSEGWVMEMGRLLVWHQFLTMGATGLGALESLIFVEILRTRQLLNNSANRMSDEKIARPIGKLTQELLGEPFPDEEKRAERRRKAQHVAVVVDEEKEEGGIPWFLIGSIVILIIVVGIAGFIAYKYWKRRQAEMSQAVEQSQLPQADTVTMPA